MGQLRVKIDRSIKSYCRSNSAAPRKLTRELTIPKMVTNGTVDSDHNNRPQFFSALILGKHRGKVPPPVQHVGDFDDAIIHAVENRIRADQNGR
jgi:hypothetical protein